VTPTPRFSIVLCTRNRAVLLGDALESLRGIQYPPSEFELVLVDNASTDDTPEVARRFAAGSPFSVECVFETKRGLSAARNRGIQSSRGRYLVFTDDDQLVDPQILIEHERVAEKYGSRVVQGAIALRFSGPRPEWLYGKLAAWLGETEPLAEGPQPVALYGGNLCLRKDLFRDFAAFREDLGKGAAGFSEDTELANRLRAAGEEVVFAPAARVYHVIGPDRVTPAFFRRSSFEKGRSHGRLGYGDRGPLRVGARAALDAALLGLEGLAFELLRDRHRSLVAESGAAFDLGRVVACAGALLRGGGGSSHLDRGARPP